MVLNYISVTRGRLKDLEALNVSSGIAAVVEPLADAPSPSAPASSTDTGPRAVRDGNAPLEATRRKFPDNVRVVSSILSSRISYRLSMVLFLGAEPGEAYHDIIFTQLSTQCGCLQYHVDQSCGRYDKLLVSIWRVLSSDATLSQLELTQGRDFAGSHHVLEDKLVAETLVDYLRELVAGEIATGAWYSERPPICFMKALSPSYELKRAGMRQMEGLWNAQAWLRNEASKELRPPPKPSQATCVCEDTVNRRMSPPALS